MQARDQGEASNDPLSKWVPWVDQAIEDAQERGDFNNLPGYGKPLTIDENPYAGDRALGFHVLSNAGIKPLWMELDREIQAVRLHMDELLERVSTDLPASDDDSPPNHLIPSGGWRWRLTRLGARCGLDRMTGSLPGTWSAARQTAATGPGARPWAPTTGRSTNMQGSVGRTVGEGPEHDGVRANAQRRYLRLAEELDEKIRLYNHALPPELRHLERMRMTVGQALATFEAAGAETAESNAAGSG